MRYARRRAALEAGRYNAVARRGWERTRDASPNFSLLHAINKLLLIAAVLFFCGFFLLMVSPVTFVWVVGCIALTIVAIGAWVVARRAEFKRQCLASHASTEDASASQAELPKIVECRGPVPRMPCPRRAQVLRAEQICEYCHWLATGEQSNVTPR